MGKIIDRGSAKPDDPIYSSGLILGGQRSKPSAPTPPAAAAATTPPSSGASPQLGKPETTGSHTAQPKKLSPK